MNIVRQAPKLLIFDFDGTLVESEAVTCEVIAKKLHNDGVHLPMSIVAEQVAGSPWNERKSRLEAILKHQIRDGLIEEARTAARELTFSKLAPTRGAIQLLTSLKIPYCIASGSSRADLISRMRAANILQIIGPRFFSSDDVKLNKPDPGVFLLAAEVMGYSTHECLVIEDSVSGAEAAQRAAMDLIVFVGGNHQTERTRNNLGRYKPMAEISDLMEVTNLLNH